MTKALWPKDRKGLALCSACGKSASSAQTFTRYVEQAIAGGPHKCDECLEKKS